MELALQLRADHVCVVGDGVMPASFMKAVADLHAA